MPVAKASLSDPEPSSCPCLVVQAAPEHAVDSLPEPIVERGEVLLLYSLSAGPEQVDGLRNVSASAEEDHLGARLAELQDAGP